MTTTDGWRLFLQLHGKPRARHLSRRSWEEPASQTFHSGSHRETQREPQDSSHSVGQTVALSAAGLLCCIWRNVIFTLQYVLPCVHIGSVESAHTQTHARIQRLHSTEKLFFHTANSGAKHTARVLKSCHNLSLAFPTGPSGEHCI